MRLSPTQLSHQFMVTRLATLNALMLASRNNIDALVEEGVHRSMVALNGWHESVALFHGAS